MAIYGTTLWTDITQLPPFEDGDLLKEEHEILDWIVSIAPPTITVWTFNIYSPDQGLVALVHCRAEDSGVIDGPATYSLIKQLHTHLTLIGFNCAVVGVVYHHQNATVRSLSRYHITYKVDEQAWSHVDSSGTGFFTVIR